MDDGVSGSLAVFGQGVWSALPVFEESASSHLPLIVLTGGLLIALLLAALLILFKRLEATIRLRIDEGTAAIARLAEERRQALNKLNGSNRLLLMTEATAHIGHWQYDLGSKNLFWSDEMFRIHGLEPGTPPKLEDVLALYHPDDRQKVTLGGSDTGESGEPASHSVRLLRKNGEIRYVDFNSQSERDENGKMIAQFGVVADRTDERIMLNQLTSARDQAQGAVQAKSAFLANMSHEIRTPMNGVLGFAELLTTASLPAPQHQQAEMILESGRNMMRLLNDILDLSKVEAGRLTFTDAPIDLHQLLGNAADMVRPMAEQKALKLELRTAADLPEWIVGDKLRLRQIIGNLLSNAIKFTRQGTVTLDVDMAGAGMEKTLVIAVIDTGIGITKADQRVIFEGFAQGACDAHARFGGTGLGLAISVSLANLMQGDITVESVPAQGSTFTFSLPLRLSENRPGAPLENAADKQLAFAGRVLVAEDNRVNQLLVSAMLDQLGIRFDIAEDGVQAVVKIKQAKSRGEPYGLVLMDIAMPQMDGYEAATDLRLSGIEADELPIIALSANAFAEDEAKSLAAGMQAHIGKPVRVRDLTDCLEKYT